MLLRGVGVYGTTAKNKLRCQRLVNYQRLVLAITKTQHQKGGQDASWGKCFQITVLWTWFSWWPDETDMHKCMHAVIRLECLFKKIRGNGVVADNT